MLTSTAGMRSSILAATHEPQLLHLAARASAAFAQTEGVASVTP
jgi:hypothetical protein